MKQAYIDQVTTRTTSVPRPRGWVAQARLLADGSPCGISQQAELLLFCLSVHEDFSANLDDRIALLHEVANRFGTSVPANTASLWVFPGGYFGFNASAATWTYLDHLTGRRLERAVLRAVGRLPVHATVALGVDSLRNPAGDGAVRQNAWVGQRHPGGSTLTMLTRGESPLEHRQFSVGPLTACFFICGEFTGSRTSQNGPFFKDKGGSEHFLDDPVHQLSQCNLLIDLAHRQVSGSVSGSCNRRMIHRLQMERFSQQGAGVLAHHHRGCGSAGRAHFKHQSNWVVFRGGHWLESTAITAI